MSDALTTAAIVPTYNRADLLVQTLESLLKQTHRPEEIVVVDDGSTDKTGTTLVDYESAVRIISLQNAGKAHALNVALEATDADYIWIMDDDDIALPDALERHLHIISRRRQPTFTYSGYYAFRGDFRPELCNEASRVECEFLDDDEFSLELMRRFRFYMQGMLVPAVCYEQVGPFNEQLDFNEDYEMILRLARAFSGCRVEGPTFMRRLHDGWRGSAENPRRAEDRRATFREYDRTIFLGLYESLPLVEYLPRSRRKQRLDAGDERAARLQRAWIMALHGLYDFAYADLDQVLIDANGDTGLSRRDERIFSAMFNVNVWWLNEYSDFPPRIGGFLRARRARHALGACARGLGWRLSREIRCLRLGNAAVLAIHFWRLTGFWGALCASDTVIRRHRWGTA